VVIYNIKNENIEETINENSGIQRFDNFIPEPYLDALIQLNMIPIKIKPIIVKINSFRSDIIIPKRNPSTTLIVIYFFIRS
jgi:hypothetical protein